MDDNTSAFCASEYDEEIRKALPYYEEFYQQVIDIVKVKFNRPLTWLDVGCGTGKMAEAALKAVDIEQFVLCDSSEKMIEFAKGRFEGNRTQFLLSSFLELQNTHQYDVITAIQVFHYFQRGERAEAVKKCYDSLSSDGIFLTFENFAPYSEAGRQLFLERWKSYQLSQGKDTASCDEHISRYGREYFPITISDHLALLKQCGFAHSELIWVSNLQVGLLGIKS